MTPRILIPAAILAATPLAHAQNALGDGTALDYNLRSGGSGVNSPIRSLDQVLRFQNAIVTGNAPGGFSFRGDVDYRAPGEFTGGLGAGGTNRGFVGQEVYSFRRDALFSGIGGRGIRGTEALQFQFELLSGSNNTTNLRGLPTLPRPNLGAYAADIVTAPTPDRRYGRTIPLSDADAPPLYTLDVDDPAFDRRGDTLAGIRSPSAFVASDALRPQVVDRQVDEQGRMFDMTATTLGGINRVPLEAPSNRVEREAGAPAQDRPAEQPARPGQDRPRIPDPLEGARTFEHILDDLENIEMPPAEGLPDGVDLPDEVDLPENADRPGAAAPRTWQERMQDLRESLRMTPERSVRTGPRDDAQAPRDTVSPDPVTVDILRRSAGEIDVLSPIGVGGIDAYTVNMNQAEDLLDRGLYFDAEERFARALAARNGDPMAAVGRVHAQIGAGMHLSATLNLRRLFTENPEIIGATYDESLLPNEDRLAQVKNDLRARLTSGSGLPREAALVLAYLGYQTDDQASLSEGLDIAATYAEDTQDRPLQRLVALLRGVWKSEDQSTGDDD